MDDAVYHPPMRKILLALAMLAACYRKPQEVAPPIAHGACSVSAYEGGRVSEQTCNYDGYWWTCGDTDCVRGPRIGREEPHG